METQYYINLETQYGANNYTPLDVVITKGQDIWIEDVDGKRYLDFLSAYSAINQGHYLIERGVEHCISLINGI